MGYIKTDTPCLASKIVFYLIIYYYFYVSIITLFKIRPRKTIYTYKFHHLCPQFTLWQFHKELLSNYTQQKEREQSEMEVAMIDRRFIACLKLVRMMLIAIIVVMTLIAIATVPGPLLLMMLDVAKNVFVFGIFIYVSASFRPLLLEKDGAIKAYIPAHLLLTMSNVAFSGYLLYHYYSNRPLLHG